MNKTLKILAILAIAASFAMAGGYQLYSESATDALSLAGAVVGRQGMSSSPWYNPAAATSVKRITISGGGTLLKLSCEYDSPYKKDDMDDPWRYTGFFYAIVPIDNTYTFTLSVNAPYGMVTHWKSGWQEDNLCTYTSLRNMYITPNLAIKLTDELSVAAGFNIVYGVARLAKCINGNELIGMPNNKLYMRADGVGYGYTASIHYQLNDDWGFGAHYQSRVKVKYTGRTDFRTEGSYYHDNIVFENGDVDTTLYLPATAAIGIANKTFERWTLSADIVWTEWKNFDKLTINFDRYPGTGKPGYSSVRRDWDNCFSYRFGAEYQLTDNWVLRGGYMYDQTPTNSQTNAPEMPDADKHYFAIGAGYSTENWAFDFGYAYVYFQKSKIGSDRSAVNWNASHGRGKFDTDCHLLSAMLTLRF